MTLDVGALNIDDALEEAKSLADFLSLCEFKNANGWRWSVGPEGGRHLAAAVLAHLRSDAVIERMIRAACHAKFGSFLDPPSCCGQCTAMVITTRAAVDAIGRE